MPKSHVLAQRVGILLCVISVLWLFFLCLKPGVEELLDGESLTVIMLSIVAIPGGLLACYSWKLVRGEVTRISIKNALGMFFGMGIFFVAFAMNFAWFRLGLPEMWDLELIVFLFLSVALGVPTYAYCTRALIRASGFVAVKGEFVGRGSYIILAWLLFFILTPVFQKSAPLFETDTAFDIVIFLFPVLIPYGLYRFAVRFLVCDTIEQEVALNYADWKKD